MPRRQSFLQGALLLTAGVLLVKVIGALFKIPLSAIITEAGMGYFGTAYSFYNVIFSIATAGMPVAVSRMVSAQDALGHWREVRRIRSVALPLFCAMGAVGMLLMLGLAPAYTRAVQNPGALFAMLALAPSVWLCSMAAAYRGYFEGLRDMTPTAVSQVVEAAAKLLFGLLFAWIAVRLAPEDLRALEKLCVWGAVGDLPDLRYAFGAAGAIIGVTLGSLLSALYLFAKSRHGDGISLKLLQNAPMPRSKREITKDLLSAALPLSVGAVALSVSGLIDASFMQTRLAYVVQNDPQTLFRMYAGSIPTENLASASTVPNYLFGCYNMALTLFMLVPSITQAFGMSALPSVTRAYTGGDRRELKKSVEDVLRMTCAFSIPAGLGLSVLAKPIACLLYGERISVPIVALALSVMGVASIFAAVTTPLGSLLQAVGQMELPVILTVGGLLVKVVLNYVFVGLPQVNILGGGLSTLISYALVTAAQWIALKRITGVRTDTVKIVVKPTFAAILCCSAAVSVERLQAYFGVGGRFSAVISILFAVLIYLAAMLLLGAVEKTDINRIFLKEKMQKHSKNT